MGSQSNLFDDLEAEFCPRLDSSLLAAFLADIEYDRDGNSKTPTSFEIQSLRNNLREIADAAELSEQLENVEIATYTEDTASTPSLYLGETATSSSNASVATTPLGFLQAALPHIDADQLDKALDNAQKADGEMDMWDVIANILTAESIREMEERGLEGLDDYESPVQEHAWATVTGKGSKSAGKKKKKRTPTIAIADIRQQHHIRPQPVRRYTTEPVGPAPDAWTQLASLSTHVASFVPSQESSFFLSHFHSPRYSSPYAALCTALAPSPYQWQAVRKRRGPDRPPPITTIHVPAYTRDVNGMKVKGSGNGHGKGGKGDVGELEMYRRRMKESLRKRDEMLREATRSWQKGTSKSHGGEVALFFAERARQFQEMAKKDGLELARLKVESKRTDPYTVDLHGTTASEAVYIVRDLVNSIDVSAKPLSVITGRGSHSVNQTSVLKPAVRKALTEDGYSVSSWDGGLYVSAKRL
ncbi:hypothetical protein CPB85DRAFT_1301873 [Mucidula mucida]|nr:hypothetical protein CPB85DRAFT_1301873 [Mucidula mucida]